MKGFLLIAFLISFLLIAFANEAASPDSNRAKRLMYDRNDDRFMANPDKSDCDTDTHTCYSASVGLSKEKSSNIAQCAAAEAKAASEAQAEAAKEAEQKVKCHFAEKATQAAKAAEGAAMMKKQIVDQKQNEVNDAKLLLHEEDRGVEIAKFNVRETRQALVKAKEHVGSLNCNLDLAKENLKFWNALLTCKREQLNDNIRNYNLARDRLSEMMHRFSIARTELDNTKRAACKAAEAAKRALVNAEEFHVKRQTIESLHQSPNSIVMKSEFSLNDIYDRNCVNDNVNWRFLRSKECEKCDGVNKGSTINIAQSAAAVAKAASDAQEEAAIKAAQQVKIRFAERALQAAKAAEAVMTEKSRIVEHIQSEYAETKILLQQEYQGVCIARINLNAAEQASTRAHILVNQISHSVSIGKQNTSSWEQLLKCDENYLDEKKRHHDAAAKRLEQVEHELRCVHEDYEHTKEAAYVAAAAGRRAQEGTQTQTK